MGATLGLLPPLELSGWPPLEGRGSLGCMYTWHAVACCHRYFEVRAYLTITWAYKPVSPQLWR